MLSMLLQAHDDEGASLTKDELVGQLSFLIFAGFESTVHALSFAAYLLAQHPEVSAKLHDEVRSLLRGDAPTVEQLRVLPYLDAVVKESLRLLSPVPFLLRTTEESASLGGFELPPRTELMLSIYHTHRMPDLFADPKRFVPERWERINPGPYEYMPFSVGPHMCAGKALALMEMKVVLAMIIQRFRLELSAGTSVDRHMLATLGPRGGMWMRVRPQDRNFAESRAPNAGGHLAEMVDL
jgi:cytochrome P450